MKFLKLSSVFICVFLFMGMAIPKAEAKHCKHHHHKRSKSSFGLSLNFGAPSYVTAAPVAPAVVAAPTYQYAAPAYQYPAYVAATPYPSPYAYPAYVAAPAYSYYQAPVVMQSQAQSVFVQPGFSYTSYRSY